MNLKRRSAYPAARSWLVLTALFFLLLASTGCEELFGEVASEVKESYGVDINNPAEMAVTAFGAQTMGNETAADGLDVYRAIQRVEHEQRGDKLLRQDENYPQARKEYQEALKWAPTGSTAQKNKVSNLYYRIANTYEYEAEETADKAKQMELYRQAGRNKAKSAEMTDNDYSRELRYLRYRCAGYTMFAGGDKAAGCDYLRKGKAGPLLLLDYGCR